MYLFGFGPSHVFEVMMDPNIVNKKNRDWDPNIAGFGDQTQIKACLVLLHYVVWCYNAVRRGKNNI